MYKEKVVLNYFTYVVALQKEHKTSAQITAIYSYMLVKFVFFKAQNKQYFESIESIAESCCCSVATVKTSIKQLQKIGVVQVTKLAGARFNRNCYEVQDKYGVFAQQTKK